MIAEVLLKAFYVKVLSGVVPRLLRNEYFQMFPRQARSKTVKAEWLATGHEGIAINNYSLMLRITFEEKKKADR